MSKVAVIRRSRSELHDGAPKVAQQLRSTEAAIDTTIAEIASLTSILVTVRMDAQISAVVGQDALISLGEAMNTMIKGRASIVDAHNRLAETGTTLRIDPAAYGGLELKPAMP